VVFTAPVLTDPVCARSSLRAARADDVTKEK
jgi:hypothetical protein